jgi:hypothetical protein
MAAHTLLAKGWKVPEAVIETARAVGSHEDPKLEALRAFTLNLIENRSWTSPESSRIPSHFRRCGRCAASQ